MSRRERWERWVQERIDGDLGDVEARLLDEALARHPDLAEEGEALAALARRLGALPRTVEPERDLWPAISARLEEETAHPRPRRWLQAAALVALLAAAFLAGRWVSPPPGVDRAPETAVAATAPMLPPSLEAAYASLEGTQRELLVAFEARRADLPPATLALVEKNLATIGEAIAEIERALDAHPSDAQLARRLVAYKTREIALLEQAQRAAARL